MSEDFRSLTASIYKKNSYFPNVKRQKHWLAKSWRYWYLRFIRLRGKPAEIARGLAVGIFAGSFPIFGFQILIGVLLAVIVRGNKFAAAAGTWVSNPLTYVPIFAFNYQVGKLILGWDDSTVTQNIVDRNWQSFMELGSVFLTKLFLGCFVVGLIAAIATYFISLQLLTRSRTLRSRRRNKKYKSNV
ncbi:MAG: DUF2062 domain-containing protein [Hydrococcus sp. Prado102]|jgi:hypothetical protein|nr:DUF2062 domain-containing protein [Hydrococcus sp. Prado102]